MPSDRGGARELPERRWAPWLSLGAALASVAVACAIDRPWEGIHMRDGAFYAYLAALQARGIAPYRDVFLLQAPLLVWLGGVAVKLGGSAGLTFLGACVHGSMTFGAVRLAIGAQRIRSLSQAMSVALIAWGVSTGWPFVGRFIVSGSRPKFLAAALSALAVHLLCTRRGVGSRLACGAALAAACWTWQPAAIPALGIVAGWSAARVLEDGRRCARELLRSALGVLLGAVALSAVAVAVLLVQGALPDFVAQAIRYSSHAYGPGATWRALFLVLPLPVTVVGGAGTLTCVVWLARGRDVTTSTTDGTRQIVGAVLGWLAATLGLLWIDFDFRGDTVPLLIPLAVLAGIAMGAVGTARNDRQRLAIAALLTFWLAGGDLLAPFHHSPHPYGRGMVIPEAAALEAKIAARGRGVLVFADPLLAQMLDEDPKHPYVFWETGMLAYIEAHERGGVSGFLDRLVAKRYGVVTLGPRARELLPYLAPKLHGIYVERLSLHAYATTFVLAKP